MAERSVLTVATTNVFYLRLAENLARSFRLWNSAEDIRFVIATDLSNPISKDLGWVEVKRYKYGSLGVGYASKLNLDWIVDDGRTLFIDADCLVFKPLGPVFDAFAGRAVSGYGTLITGGEWFGDVSGYLSALGLQSTWQFNSGIYYLEKGKLVDSIFSCARKLESCYDQIGLRRLHGNVNDEILVSLAIALHGLDCLPYEGHWIMAEFQGRAWSIDIDIFRGVAYMHRKILGLSNDHKGPRICTINPSIVHFMGGTVRTWQYRRNVNFLSLALSGRIGLGLAPWLAFLTHDLMGRVRDRIAAMACKFRKYNVTE